MQLVKCEFRCHKVDNLSKLREHVMNSLVDFTISDHVDVNETFSKFNDILYKSYNACCPVKLKTISVKRANNPWLTPRLLTCMKRKHELFRLSLVNDEYKTEYKRYRNVLTSLIRNSKKEYFNNKFDACKTDIKRTWTSINSILRPTRVASRKLEIHSEGNLLSDPLGVATAFNEHYTSVAVKLANQIPKVDQCPIDYVSRCPNSFVYFPTGRYEIEQIVRSFKSKGSHISSIPSFVYKHIIDILSPIIASLVNVSVSQGVYPDILKTARVIPVFKSGDKRKVVNYRPISTLEFLNKIYEKLIFNRFNNFFRKYGIICDEQYGFLRGRSTSDAVLRYAESVYGAFNDSQYLLSVMLDFSKAFDTVDHEILQQKLFMVGIRGFTLNLVKSYLSGRTQLVSVGGKNSVPLPICTGVPQGSILGPLLFLVYINDMRKSTDLLNFIHFADDTTVFLKDKCLSNLYDTINSELEKVDRWLCANKLSLNLDKTSYMIHSNCNRNVAKQILIRDKVIKCVTNSKFLGVIIDDKFNFKDHITLVCNKISKSCGILRRLSYIIPKYVLKKIYLSLVYPYLVYCVEVWGDGSKTALSRLSVIQDRCVKLLGDSDADVVSVYRNNNLFMRSSIYNYFILIKFYQYFREDRNAHFKLLIENNQIHHKQNTRFRANECLNYPLVLKSKCFSCFVFSAVKLWNKLPIAVRNSNSAQCFKQALRKFLIC